MIKSMNLRRALRGTTLAFAAVAAVSVAGPASASSGAPTTYDNAHVIISGGNARGVANCVQIAKTVIRHHAHSRTQACDPYAEADGGSVTLQNVSATVYQSGRSRGRVNNATIEVTGGDADAVSSCYQVLHGTASNADEQSCSATATAVGGNVDLNNVDISIIQA